MGANGNIVQKQEKTDRYDREINGDTGLFSFEKKIKYTISKKEKISF